MVAIAPAPVMIAFVLLVVACVGGPYLLAVRPRTRGDWLLVALTIALLFWLLPLMATLRSR